MGKFPGNAFSNWSATRTDQLQLFIATNYIMKLCLKQKLRINNYWKHQKLHNEDIKVQGLWVWSGATTVWRCTCNTTQSDNWVLVFALMVFHTVFVHLQKTGGLPRCGIEICWIATISVSCFSWTSLFGQTVRLNQQGRMWTSVLVYAYDISINPTRKCLT